MGEPLDAALGRVRDLVLSPDSLVRAVGTGTRRGAESRWRRVEARYVEVKAGRLLQLTCFDRSQAFTANHSAADAPAAVNALLAEPFSSWRVETSTVDLRVQVTKRGEAVLHQSSRAARPATHDHDRAKRRLLPEDDPLFAALGLADAQGRIKPSRQAKYRQVEEFVRALDVAVDAVPLPTDRPLHVVDLGCGNAYLTFAAHRYLTAVRGLPIHLVGVDVKQQSLDHGTALARELGVGEEVSFVQGTIGSVELGVRPDVVLALHACDTATDDALAQAVRWEAPLILAAPCCHHDVAAQLRAGAQEVPTEFRALLRDGILRERFADTLTDALRADALREKGYRVDVMEFVESRHTPRNTLLRAVRTGVAAPVESGLAERLGVRPRIRELLG